MMRNRQQAALVTGGSKRLGKSISLALAERGYDIALHYGTSRETAEQTAEAIREYHVQCRTFQCDLNDLQKTGQLVSRVLDTLPHCGLLVNNASVFRRNSFLDTDTEFLEKHLTVNFKAPFILTRQFALLRKSGHVINMLDTKITRASEQFFAYTLSKKLLFEFTQMAAKDLGPAMRVNGICPGIILPSSETSEEVLEKMIRKLPLRQQGTTEDILRGLYYLIDNKFVTGDCLFIDGGEHL